MADKKDYICAAPFTSIELHDGARFLCCASWLKKYLPEHTHVYDAWNSKEANDIRDSVLDGSYRYCDTIQCPRLNQLEKFGEIGRIRPLYHKNKLPSDLKETVEKYKKGEEIKPSVIQFSFDRSCNLACPSCRLNMIIADKAKIKQVKKEIQKIEDTYGNDVDALYITGTGDPFISVGFRDFLRNFDKSRWPRLKNIHLHTNATRWNKKMWDSMPNVHKYVKSCEISIDASTKYTYENHTRINGDWDELIENLKFISTLPNLTRISTSFVVQRKNYKEMKSFYNLMTSIFGKKVNVYYGKITNWGTFTDEEFKNEMVWDKSHPEHNEFLKEVNKTLPAQQATTNMQEFVIPQKSII